jgi:aminopeptidase-like protein
MPQSHAIPPFFTPPADGLVALGQRLHRTVAELYPICRSITGAGLRETLARLARIAPIQVHEVASGTAVHDWTVPDEWNIREAWIADAAGARVVDFAQHNLHVVSYSEPVRARMSLAELRPHLHTLPEHPDWIPYRTAYYRRGWGFCLRQRTLDALADGEYEVHIDSTLAPGSMSYGELLLPGATPDEILISCHVCHPSLANDNLSGVAIAAHLAQHLATLQLRHSVRFVFVPATIGAIAWLAHNPAVVARIRAGVVLAGLGDSGVLHYKKSRYGATPIDRTAAHVLRQAGAHELLEFSPTGYDERQYNSPGYQLPVGRLSRTPFGRYAEYHSSADDLDFVKPEQLAAAFDACLQIVGVLDLNRRFLNRLPMGEPQLGRRGLYAEQAGASEIALLWVLNLSDGHHDLLEIAERSGLPFADIATAAARLQEHDLLELAP